MQSLHTLVTSYLNKENVFLVFPSDVISRQILRNQLLSSADFVLPRYRFLTWDQFKEQTLEYPPLLLPVNNYIRALFCMNILKDNRRAPVFQSIVNPEFAEHSLNLGNLLKKNLPLLKHISDQADGSQQYLSKKKLQDIQCLYGLYQQFLSENGLYEPEYEKPEFNPDGNKYIIFYPEVILDYETVKPFIESSTSVELVHIQQFNTKISEITRFDNTKKEIDFLIKNIHVLLKEHVSVDDIVITVAGHDSVLPYLKKAAYCYDIPLNIHIGTPLSALPGVAFFRHIERIDSSGFALDELKLLVWNKSVPWKNKELMNSLVDFGIKYSCIKNYYSGTGFIDVWNSNFKKIQKNPGPHVSLYKMLQVEYQKLKKAIQDIIRAKSFLILDSAIKKFCSEFLEFSLFTESEKNNFQLAYKILLEFQRNAERILTFSADSPYHLWFSMLQEKMYVPQFYSPGISVYPYRVSAGIDSDYHFVINADSQGTNICRINYPLLSPAELTAIPQTEINLSEAFLELYLGLGKQVSVSYAQNSYDGPRLPPSFFIEKGEIRPYGTDMESTDTKQLWGEFSLWDDFKIKPDEVMFSIQQSGIVNSEYTVFQDKIHDFSQLPVTDKTVQAIISKLLVYENGMLHVNFTDFELFMNCRFRYFLEKIIRLDSPQFEINYFEQRWYGILIHYIFERFFSLYKETQSSLPDKDQSIFRQMLQEKVEKASVYWTFNKPIPPEPVWKSITNNLSRGFEAFADAEYKRNKNYQVIGAEERYKADLSTIGITIYGDLDLVAEDENGVRIVDFKKNNMPTKKAHGAAEPSSASLQIPFYTMLLEKNSSTVSNASYYSFFQQKYQDILTSDEKKHESQRALLDAAMHYIEKSLIQMLKNMKSFDFSIGESNAGDCRYCSWRSVCRTKYYLRN